MPRSPLPRLRRHCLALPEAHEVIAWGEPTFRVRNRMFAMFASAANHHGAGRHAVWVKSDHTTQDALVRTDPGRYFVPPYVGVSGWFGIHLSDDTDWSDVDIRLRDAYRRVAPKPLIAVLEAMPARPRPRRASSS